MYFDCRRIHQVFQLSQKERHMVYHWEQFLCRKTWHPFHCSKKMHFTYYSINLMSTVMNTRKWTVSIHSQPETVEVKQLSIKYKFTFVVQFIPFPQHAAVKFSHLDDFVENRFGYWHSTMWCTIGERQQSCNTDGICPDGDVPAKGKGSSWHISITFETENNIKAYLILMHIYAV